MKTFTDTETNILALRVGAMVHLRSGSIPNMHTGLLTEIINAAIVEISAVDTVVEANRQLLLERSNVGIKKYNTPLDKAGLSHVELLQHALEEALDFSNYIQTIIMKLKAENV